MFHSGEANIFKTKLKLGENIGETDWQICPQMSVQLWFLLSEKIYFFEKFIIN